MSLLILSSIFFLLTTFSYIFFIKISKKKGFVEKKNEFIKRDNEVIRSGGIVFSLIICLYFFVQGFFFKQNYNDLYRSIYILPFLIFISTIIFFIDDKYDIPKRIRFIVQLILCFLGLSLIKLPVIDFLPSKIEILLLTIFWCYLMNISNFLDGIDGYLGINFIFFCISSLIILDQNLSSLHSFFYNDIIIFIIIISSFLIFNLPKAKIFMGDSGSITIGLLVGFIFLKLYEIGYRYELLFLYSFFILDVTYTLLNRVFIKKVLPWERLFDYVSFTPVIKYKKKHSYILITSSIFNSLNLMILLVYIKTDLKYLIFISILLSLIQLFFLKKEINK